MIYPNQEQITKRKIAITTVTVIIMTKNLANVIVIKVEIDGSETESGKDFGDI